jgi:hypothetical protein
MGEKTRKKMALEAKGYGGLTIPHLKLQVHQNGAKFPICKVYIDDEHLDQDTLYTIIIIPEGPRIMGVILSYFDSLKGPTILHVASASKVDARLEAECQKWMDAMDEPGFTRITANGLSAVNYLFEIESAWGSAGKDQVMISFVTGTKPNAIIEDTVEATFTEFGETMKREQGLFKAFYAGREKIVKPTDLPDIESARKKLVQHVESLYKVMDPAFNPQD